MNERLGSASILAQANDAEDRAVSTEYETRITLGLLNAVEANSAVTQRSVARDLGIALGLANAYLKRCVRKGLVKVQQVPANRYAYYLTPRGFAEKSQLTADYLTISFRFFRRAREECAVVFDDCIARGWDRIVLAGADDLGEIAFLCATDMQVNVVAFQDAAATRSEYLGLPVVARLEDLPPFDVVVVTNFHNPQATFDALIETVPAERVLAPTLLAISRVPPTGMA
jgi:DNA-binding MarR family transcriptional regulator